VPGVRRARRVIADRELALALGLVEFTAAAVVALVAGGDHVAGDSAPAIPHRPDVLGGHQAQVWACTHKIAIGGSDLINVRFADSSRTFHEVREVPDAAIGSPRQCHERSLAAQ
jgi:hypothetical protein